VREEVFFWTFVVQWKITEADTLTTRMGATASRLISNPLPSPLPHFYSGCPSIMRQPFHIILAWDRQQIWHGSYPAHKIKENKIMADTSTYHHFTAITKDNLG